MGHREEMYTFASRGQMFQSLGSSNSRHVVVQALAEDNPQHVTADYDRQVVPVDCLGGHNLFFTHAPRI